MLLATLVITVLGTSLGLLLGLAGRFMAVEDENPLVKEIEGLLPGSQCGQCGLPGCSSAAVALAEGTLDISFCPPGGRTLVERLAAILDVDISSIGEVPQPMIATINDSACSGCTRCYRACPTDAIVGANGQIHIVLASACTGCKKCVDACPEDCVSLINLPATPDSWHWVKPTAA
ncbi:RnfABCDGE type electron transport complex subunit B [Teredinibacter haidensis]|uniref:RnfABCDGE type electron transport complex subunit B n=1 Tax=Teredinibacter haidensis TaxID=2731755 RepID=UPI000948BD39|nr:RnfABCDGE type electron transport complex subunit B [Teredinibacter haidensis]